MIRPLPFTLLAGVVCLVAVTLPVMRGRASAMSMAQTQGRNMDYSGDSDVIEMTGETTDGEKGEDETMLADSPHWASHTHRHSSPALLLGARFAQDNLVAVPMALVHTSQALQQDVNCSKVRASLHSNSLTPSMLLQPPWLHLSPSLGSCPTQYVVRHLGPNTSPSALLEARCLCKGEPCSNEGHQCVPVSRQVPVLHGRGAPSSRSLSLQEVVVGCACVLRPGLMADYVLSPWLQN
ncbi:uncharacterized protein LOC125178204 [Hyalella azteca]|uniref:Uncharacterized protein LOC125178204 n=1 Tax=Hyalella azteca TaxID=294128 RepID=A0A979FK33_HYAAZ|nr:uncharacterized protein LOC125178204 [Hyalella azteca]